MVYHNLQDGAADEVKIPVTVNQLGAIIVLLILSMIGGVALAYLLVGGDANEVNETTRREIKTPNRTEQLNVGVLVAPHNLKERGI